MGACISIHHKASETKTQVSFDSTKKSDHKPVVHSTHSSRKNNVVDGHVAVKPQLPPSTFSDYGSKEEVFFDSQAWLDSDYEDEFMSVNGEFTPSRGNTPVHHSLISSKGNTFSGLVVEPLGSTAQSSPAPTEKRKRLLDLFKESIRDNHGSPNNKFAEPPNKYGDKTSSKKNGLRSMREKPAGSAQGCFASLLSVRSTGRQTKKSLIPGLKLTRSRVEGS